MPTVSRDSWLILLAMSAFLARLGLAFYLAGSSRSKNAATGMMRAVMDLCMAVLAFWGVGYAIWTWDYRAIGDWNGMFSRGGLFPLTTVLIATGAALGGTLERAKMMLPLTSCLLLSMLIIPVVGLWTNAGWLFRLAIINQGGVSAMHLCGGLVALVAAMALGPRRGKYNHDGSANLIPGHSAPITAAGTLAMAAGFLAQIACFTDYQTPDLVGAALTNGLLAAAAGGVAAALLARWRYAVFDFHFALAGFLSGLISCAAGAATLPGVGAVLTGAVGGLLTANAITWIDLRRKIDDPGAGFAIHAVAGGWGLLAAGLLAPAGAIPRQMLIQIGGVAAIATFTLIVSAAVFKTLKSTVGLTFGEADELDGSDLVEHELNAYPDFQQTMIKSYHLRET